MTEFTADPGLPAWNTNSNYWYGLGIFVGPTPQTWSHGGAIAGARSELMRDKNGYIWSIITNSLSPDGANLGSDLDSTMQGALGSGLEGSASDLYLDYPSPDLPARQP